MKHQKMGRIIRPNDLQKNGKREEEGQGEDVKRKRKGQGEDVKRKRKDQRKRGGRGGRKHVEENLSN